ncbi:MAG TPA: HNH endonuclease [Armatimonadota bacterium]|nr:HNH endonuclease [Armatimonadota bacterium]
MPALSTLFDTFSHNLALYRKDYGGRFMCPLCLRTFSRDQIRSDLSRAHVIPQFLGERNWTLACKRCNNRVGTEIESCEAERANFNWALSGDGNETTRVRVTARNQQGDVVGPVQADLGARRADGDRRLQLYLKPKGSNPAALALLNSLVSGESPAGGWTIEVTFRDTRSSKRANLTYVHAAYLFMFHQFGYEWVLDPCAEPIRNQIMSPSAPIIVPLAPALYDHQIPDDELALLLVTEPAEWRHFLVVLPLVRGWARRHAVWMPLFGRPYCQPPQRRGAKLAVVSVPDHHRSLRRRDSPRQGYRFVLDHFAYDPVLHAAPSCSAEHG